MTRCGYAVVLCCYPGRGRDGAFDGTWEVEKTYLTAGNVDPTCLGTRGPFGTEREAREAALAWAAQESLRVLYWDAQGNRHSGE